MAQKKPNHVRLGKELRHRWQFVRADLGLGLVDVRLPAGLPELVQPAERIRCGKHLGRQAGHQRLEALVVFPRQPHLEHRQVGPEHLRQHGSGEMRRHAPLVHVLPSRQLLALVQRDRNAHLRLDEQAVLGQKPSEQHAVPVLVGALLRQMLDGLGAGVVALIAELTSMGTETAAQPTVVILHVTVRLTVGHGQCRQGGSRTGLGDLSCLHDDALDLPTRVGRQCASRHHHHSER